MFLLTTNESNLIDRCDNIHGEKFICLKLFLGNHFKWVLGMLDMFGFGREKMLDCLD